MALTSDVSDEKTISIGAEVLRNVGKTKVSMVDNDTADAAKAGLYQGNIQKRKRTPSRRPKPKEDVGINYVKLSGQRLIGRKAKIWWPKENAFHKGKIIDFSDEEKMHLVEYDGGVKDFLDLSKERWQLLKEKDSGPSPGPSNPMLRSVGVNSAQTSKRKCMEGTTHEGEEKKFTIIIDENTAPAGVRAPAPACAPARVCAAAPAPAPSPTPTHAPTPAPAPAAPIVADACYELVDVCGYQVKSCCARMLGSIFDRYGDIARDCYFKHPHARTVFLEMVCNVIQKLQSAEFGVTASQLNEMISDISDAAGANLAVSWLQTFLETISPVEEVGTDSTGLMEQRASSFELVKEAKKDMGDRKREFMEAEKRWKTLKSMNAKIEIDAVKFLQAKRAWGRMMDELLCTCRTEA